MQGGDRMRTLIIKLKDFGHLVYNPYNESLDRPRYIVPLLEYEEIEIGKMSVEEYLESLAELKMFISEEYAHVKNLKKNLYYEITAEDSFYQWTCDLACESLEEALELAGQVGTDEIFDFFDGDYIYLNENN
jgi:hypothetical protein